MEKKKRRGGLLNCKAGKPFSPGVPTWKGSPAYCASRREKPRATNEMIRSERPARVRSQNKNSKFRRGGAAGVAAGVPGDPASEPWLVDARPPWGGEEDAAPTPVRPDAEAQMRGGAGEGGHPKEALGKGGDAAAPRRREPLLMGAAAAA